MTDIAIEIQPWTLLVVRLVLAAVVLVVGFPKLVNTRTRQENHEEFGDKFGLKPAALWSWINILTETIGGVMVLVGFFAEFAALAMFIQMVMGIVIKKFKLGADFRSGWSYDAMAAALALVVVSFGPGALAVWPFVNGLR